MSIKNSSRNPIVLVFSGPNGSGKTTVAKEIATIGVYINADDMKKEFGMTDLQAAQAADALRNELLDKGADFTFETVLSTERNLLLMQKAKEKGYEVQCIYVLTCNENINVARVKARVISGGHDVPEDKIRSRYRSALALLPKVAAACDNILVYDNTETPFKIFSKEHGYTEIFPNKYWSESAIRKLLRL